MSELLVMSAIGLVVTMGPTVAYKMGAPVYVLKYMVLIAISGLLAIMASSARIGIYMTFALPMVVSIFYYDKKFDVTDFGDQLYFSCHIHVFQIFWCCTD